MAYRFLFGPVNSRRLGRSLGVDLVPAKVCSLDCVYCESGQTTTLTAARGEYVPTAAVLAELDECLGRQPALDYVTFSGAGEPTLHRDLGTIIAHLKQHHPQYRLALLTNGTLLADAALRQEILACDLIIPSLDAATDAVMARLNRPVAGLIAAAQIDGLAVLRDEYRGQLWLEIFIVPGVNDTAAELAALAAAAARIRPDRIQLNALDRPAPEPWVQAATAADLVRCARYFSGPVDIVARPAAAAAGTRPVKAAQVLDVLRRRPGTLDDLVSGLHAEREQVMSIIHNLLADGVITGEQQARGTFYRLS